METVAPNLSTLIGDAIAARLISKAGSLSNLCKYPASTVQILGAEKALFRALKTKGKTPKYGLIFNSSFIGKAGMRNKGRISRFLANKCSIAARIDNFSDTPTSKFGEALRGQVEERLAFYAEGKLPTRNEDTMKQAMDAVLSEIHVADPTAEAPSDDEVADGVTSQAVEKKIRDQIKAHADEDGNQILKEKKKDKKDKKEKKRSKEEKREKRKSKEFETTDRPKSKKRKEQEVQ